MLDEMNQQTKAIRKEIQAAKDRQKRYADPKRSERIFKEGDKVFLRVRPKRSSLSLGKYKKLSPRYCGPYEVLKRIGPQAYMLKLPEHLKVHDVFHVSLLKAYVPRADHVLSDDQAVIPNQGVLQLEPDRILETRERTLRNRTIRDHLVHWKGFPMEEATWEEESLLQKDFPELFSR